MSERAYAPKRTIRRRIAQRLRERGAWRHAYRSPWRYRTLALLNARHPWWDWGHWLMILVGQDQGGNWSQYEPPPWFYRLGEPKRMWRTGYPRHTLSTLEVHKKKPGDYSFMEYHRQLSEDEQYKWQAIAVNEDELVLGHRYWGKTFYGMNHWEVPLLRKYLRMWRRNDWYGLRSWLFAQALHAAVYQRKPGTCQEAPPKGSGGYSHWLCQEKRKHDGLHRYGNCVWGDIAGEQMRVTHVPEVR
jgi:hypothetical protein